jgi:hypothetical protein
MLKYVMSLRGGALKQKNSRMSVERVKSEKAKCLPVQLQTTLANYLMNQTLGEGFWRRGGVVLRTASFVLTPDQLLDQLGPAAAKSSPRV